MIVDVFDGDLFFHTVGMIKCSIENAQEKHFYLIKVSSAENKKLYEDLFFSKNYTEYRICAPGDNDDDIPLALRFFCWLKKNSKKSEEIILLKEMYRLRKNTLLLHGIPLYGFLLLIRWPNLNWICWGFGIRPTKLLLRLKRKLLYSKLKKIICLMQPDLEFIQKKFRFRRVFLCPYPDYFRYKMPSMQKSSDLPNNKVLVGNNGNVIHSYISLVEKLKPYKDSIDLTFMIPYGTTGRDDDIKNLKNLLQAEKFHYDFWDKVLACDEYNKKMGSYKYYICPFETQTGLGAVYTMIACDRTVYLTGFNYAWCSYLGIKVYSIDDFLEKLKNQSSLEMDIDIRKENRRQYCELFDGKRRIGKLEKLLMTEGNLENLETDWL